MLEKIWNVGEKVIIVAVIVGLFFGAAHAWIYFPSTGYLDMFFIMFFGAIVFALAFGFIAAIIMGIICGVVYIRYGKKAL